MSTTDEPAPINDARPRRGWGDRLVLGCIVLGIAGMAFAAGRFTVDPGPATVQEALQMAQAGELPFGEAGPGGAGGVRGGGDGGATRGAGAGNGAGQNPAGAAP